MKKAILALGIVLISKNEPVAENLVMKDAGINFSLTIIIAALLTVLMIAGIIITIKFDYFAESDEDID